MNFVGTHILIMCGKQFRDESFSSSVELRDEDNTPTQTTGIQQGFVHVQ